MTATTPSTERPPAPPSTSSGPTEPERKRSRRSVSHRRPNVVGGLGAGVWFVIVAVPLYFLAVTSFRASGAYLSDGPLALPRSLTADNYITVLTSQFPRYFINNLLVTVACVAIVIVLALPAAYAIVRSRSRLVSTGFSIVLLGLAVPAQAVIVPLYLMITQLRLYDSLLAIILPTAAFALPLSIVVLTSSLRDVPKELYEAITIDGAGTVRTLFSLVLPLSRSGLATIGIFTALQAWNGFLFPLVLTQNPDVRVLTLGLWDFQGQYGTNVPLVTAAVTLSLLPLLVVYLLARRFLLAGLTAGAGK
ncbi:carbohydrate ABC transporter permease [Pseudonocardia xinjiangensis]|uniref:Carbohydrate ABC transporter permease n=1 Tax=Pseudonocardia xinjiangensis TaxID=75289 RepID=A0ABX1RQG7_9PSEU|nr:carbohydrate ABC transporter permease [Pseudonocardia xinjiangensis]NMH82636.1 carbohydrate ABC transporter permease [Pseudonocardia xinjiangensis]